MTAKEPVVVVCMPADATPVPGTVIEADCGHDVNLAQTSIDIMKRETAKGRSCSTICIPCWKKRDHSEDTVMPMEPAQYRELLQSFRDEGNLN